MIIPDITKRKEERLTMANVNSFIREDDLLTYINQQKSKQQQYKNTGQNNW